jgi:MMP 1-O-methyltransferase
MDQLRSLLSIVQDTSADGLLAPYLAYSRSIPGWTLDYESLALTRLSYFLPPHSVIVEIGSFLGRSAVLFGGACKAKSSGTAHCIDPFDASGDTASVPDYRRICEGLKKTQQCAFIENIQRGGLENWISVHPHTAKQARHQWILPIDLLFLDGHHSYSTVIETFFDWIDFLKPGGILAVHNSTSLEYDHDGSTRLVNEFIKRPSFEDIGRVETTTFARKV